MTQDINLTVQKNFRTLSNGLLTKSVENSDGTRTDFWSQKKPHTPYLAMLAVGEFYVTTDTWNGIDVEYFLEKDYHQYARKIFGKTPAMLAYFSELLGVDYPWEKYAQIVVRDFVSGAMENTTAVIHGEFVQMNERELLDDHEEDIIAHELFHHWFGDLVTCESWANLPLNESFATYGEYLWREKGFGRMAADQHLDADLNSYLSESRKKQVDMIRFDYFDKEDMFDNHSYAKGGRILHMLRNILGDDAFFSGLKNYLDKNAYNTVEIHQLRIAMEEVCGADLNWFFNQWFLASGHPLLVVDYELKEDKQTVILEQIQDNTTTPVYRLPMSVDVYVDGVAKRYQIVMDQKKQRFEFETEGKITNIIVDAEHMLLAEIFDDKPDHWWLEQQKSLLYMDQKLALNNISNKSQVKAIINGLSNNFWGVRMLALDKAIESKVYEKSVVDIVSRLAKSDTKTKVKAKAIEFLSLLSKKQEYTNLFLKNINSRSYAVAGASLLAYSTIFPDKAINQAKGLEEDSKNDLKLAIKKLYASKGGSDQMSFFVNCLETEGNYELYWTSKRYVQFLKNQDVEIAINGVDALEKLSANATSWMVWVSKQLLLDMKNHFEQELKTQKEKQTKTKIKESLLRLENLLG
jgi:aminopeptidase N